VSGMTKLPTIQFSPTPEMFERVVRLMEAGYDVDRFGKHNRSHLFREVFAAGLHAYEQWAADQVQKPVAQ